MEPSVSFVKTLRFFIVHDMVSSVTEALAHAGLESSNLILGIDFTKSNEWTGSRSFHRKSLHHIGDDLNPYEMVISIIGKTLAAFDEDNLIPCYGFGDASNMSEEDFADAALFALTIATVKRACMMCTLKFVKNKIDFKPSSEQKQINVIRIGLEDRLMESVLGSRI
ncbi:putative copine [Helianthus debilis subsp. tardiflorus]